VNLVDPYGLLVTYWGIGGSAGLGPPTEGDKANFFTASGVVYEGTSRQGGTEKGVSGQFGVGRIGGLSIGAGLVAGFNLGDVEDLSGRGGTAGVTIGFISLELTFGENLKWTGFNIGFFKSIGAGIYGLETFTGRFPTSSRNRRDEPCE